MSDTPETDSLARGNHVVSTGFAQDLERQLSSARAMVHKLRRERAVARQFGEQMERERDKVRKALHEIASLDTSQDAGPQQCAAVLLAMNALGK